MLFNSLAFLIFYPIVTAVYFALAHPRYGCGFSLPLVTSMRFLSRPSY